MRNVILNNLTQIQAVKAEIQTVYNTLQETLATNASTITPSNFVADGNKQDTFTVAAHQSEVIAKVLTNLEEAYATLLTF